MKKKKIKNISNEAVFDAFYSEIFAERWPQLKKALLEPAYSVKIQFDENLEPYFLDAGSLFAGASLALEGAKSILDLCAAPGGKTLVLSAFLEENASLLSNELSMQRRERLLKVIKQSLPFSLLEKIRVSPYDGTIMYKKNLEVFDAILCDLPCSSERHVLSSPKHLSEWTKGRIKNLSYTQAALISSAFLMLKDEGSLLYATCALTKTENDHVIEKFLKKNTNAHVVTIDETKVKEKVFTKFNIKLDINLEKTDFGYHILPDTSNGAGPLYFTLIKKGK